jgi:hypothetical protein
MSGTGKIPGRSKECVKEKSAFISVGVHNFIHFPTMVGSVHYVFVGAAEK